MPMNFDCLHQQQERYPAQTADHSNTDLINDRQRQSIVSANIDKNSMEFYHRNPIINVVRLVVVVANHVSHVFVLLRPQTLDFKCQKTPKKTNLQFNILNGGYTLQMKMCVNEAFALFS